MTLNDLFLVSLLTGAAYVVWLHINMSRIARNAAKRYCEKVDVQFLDQNVVLKGISIKRSPHSLFAFQRQYHFEFSSVGDSRYKGVITLVGNRVKNIELPPYKMI